MTRLGRAGRRLFGARVESAYDQAVERMAALESASRRAFSRRRALVGAAVATIHLAFLRWMRALALAEPAPSTAPARRGARWGMTIDLDRCTGCGSCVVACRTENNVPYSGPSEKARGTEIYWMDLLALGRENEVAPQVDVLPLPCMHCDNPPCVKVCPTNATYQTEDGIVAQIWDRCIGCRFCEVACPYGRRYFNWAEPEWPESYKSFINPDVATRPEGVVEKCTLCHHRVQDLHEEARLENREPTDDELHRLPACAQVCPAEAITFGNLADPESRVARLAEGPRGFRLLEHLGTKPKVVYLRKDRRGTS